MPMQDILSLLSDALYETAFMVSISTVIAAILGLIIGILINNTSESGITPNFIVNKILDIIVNVFRSFPFIILIIIVIPLSRYIVGTSIGSKAVIVPLTIFAVPFISRLVANSLSEVDKELISAAKVIGASNWQIVSKVMIPEALPSLVNDLTITVINIIGASAMAGAVGGGGVGDLAITHGYQLFEVKLLVVTVIAIVIFVQLLQFLGDITVKRIRKKRGLAKK